MVKKRKSPFLDKLAAIFSYLLGLIFPPKCVICDDVLLNGGEMCPECLARWEKARRQKCPVCKKTARACTCHTFHMLNTDDIGDRKMTSLAFYTKFGSEDPVDITVLRLITAVKTSSDRGALRLCARELSHEILKTLMLDGQKPEDYKITFPPRSKSRIMKYGFDHSKALAALVSKYTGIPVQETLKNCGNKAQKHLNSVERKSNAEGSYKLRPDVTVSGRYIFIDDIITTGATVNAAAKMLKAAGAGSVYPVCIARTKKKKHRLRRPSQRPWFTVR